MIQKRTLISGLFALVCVAGMADSGHTFPEEGKTYVLHRFNNENAYMYESNNMLYAAPSANTQKQYWKFIPTENANCYYIQNLTTKRYVQSTHIAESEQVATGTEPVEFQIVQNQTSNAPKGYYYLCSTDQTVSADADGTFGLNYKEATGTVVAYHITWTRGNSYWDIQESTYDYATTQPTLPSEETRRLGIYNLPCGTQGNAWLSSCTIKGDKVKNELNYSATAQPDDYYHMERHDSASVIAGQPFTLAYKAQGMSSDYTVTFYFDWDADGVFEARHEFVSDASGSVEITVPTDESEASKPANVKRVAQRVDQPIHKVRMRARLNDNGLDDAEDDVNGQTYDFTIFVLPSSTPTGVNTVTAQPGNEVGQENAYAIDGRQVNLEAHEGIYVTKGLKRIK